MEFNESTDKKKPIPKELTAFLNEVQDNLGLYPETVIYNRIKEYIPVIPRKQIAWLINSVITTTEFRVRIMNTRCKSGDKLACEMLDLNINGDEYSKNPTIKKGLIGLFKHDNDIEAGKLLLEIGAITQEEFDKEIGARKQGELIGGKSYAELLNDLAVEAKKYPTADSFSMAMIMGRLESVPAPNTANVYKIISGKYKSAEDFYNAVKKGEFEIKKMEERKKGIAATEEVVPEPLIVKKVEDLDLFQKEIDDKIKAELRRRARGGGGQAGEPAGRYSADDDKIKIKFLEDLIVSAFLSKHGRNPNTEEMQEMKQRNESLIRKYGTYTYKGLENAIYSSLSIEDLENMLLAIHASNLSFEDKLKLVQKIDERRQIFKGESVAEERELKINPQEDVYASWTFDDFKEIINRTVDIDDLMELTKHIEDSKVMWSGDKVSARQLAEKRKRDIVYGTPEIKRQKEEQQMAQNLAYASRLREPPEDYKLWTFADFEPFIYNEDDIDELEQLRGTVKISNRLTESEKTELNEMIDKQIEEVLARR